MDHKMTNDSKMGRFFLISALGLVVSVSLAINISISLQANKSRKILIAEKLILGNGEVECVLRKNDFTILLAYRMPDVLGYGLQVKYLDLVYTSPRVLESTLFMEVSMSDGERITKEVQTKPLGESKLMQAFFPVENIEGATSVFAKMTEISFVQSLGGGVIHEFIFDFSSREGRNEREKFVSCIGKVGQVDNRGSHSRQVFQQCTSSCEMTRRQSLPNCTTPNYDYLYEDPSVPDVGNPYINGPHEDYIGCLQSAERISNQLESEFKQCLSKCQEYLE